MAYGVTSTGFALKTFADIRAEIDDYQRAHISEGLLLTDDSTIGQINVAHGLELAKLWELAEALYSANDPDTASNWSLVQLCALTGTQQNKYSKTLVTAQVTLNPNKALPAGSIANLTDRPSDRFISLTEVPADPSGGTFDVEFEAENEGALDVVIGQLSTITVAVSGWTGVTNAAAGVPGGEPETDPELRSKRERELVASGSTNLDAIMAGVSAVSTVVDVRGLENDTNSVVVGIPPRAVTIIVRGGADADVAEAIFVEKAAGITAFGTTNVEVDDSLGTAHNIGFVRATPLNFYATATLEVTDEWNGAASITEMETKIFNHINSLGIGDNIIYDKVKAVMFEVVGLYKILDLFIDFHSTPTGEIDLNVNIGQYAISDVANLDITVP